MKRAFHLPDSTGHHAYHKKPGVARLNEECPLACEVSFQRHDIKREMLLPAKWADATSCLEQNSIMHAYTSSTNQVKYVIYMVKLVSM